MTADPIAAAPAKSGVAGAHLVGSINLPDAETTFRTVSEHLGDRLHRIPDGEVGERFHWILFQTRAFDGTAGLSRIPGDPIEIAGFDVRPFLLEEGVDPASIEFADLGYAAAAQESYEVFARLRSEEVIRPGTRFQVSLPSPSACVASFVVPQDRAAVEPAYRAALAREVAEIVATIPAEDLAIQWDVAVEFALIEAVEIPGLGQYLPWFEGDVIDGCAKRVAGMAHLVPEGVELGFHLCYGDVAEAHFKEPSDTANLTAMANALFNAVDRPIDFIHLPVPIERDDEEYFAPLRDLALPEGTELYLGLVHREDGVEGANRRISAARSVVGSFGVATECGFGRGPRESTIPLLQSHAGVAAPV